MKIASSVLAAAVLAAISGGVQAAASWATFNGYAAGMSKADAKKVGYSDCKSGVRNERADSVFCEVNPDRRKLGSLTASTARLEFRASNLNQVSAIRTSFDARPVDLLKALEEVYGKPVGRNGYTVVWYRDTSETIEVYAKLLYVSPTRVDFEFDPTLQKRIKKQATEAAEQKRKLSNF